MSREASPETDDDLFNDIYGKAYTGPSVPTTNKNAPSGDTVSTLPDLVLSKSRCEEEEQDSLNDPFGIPTDFTSRDKKFWDAKAKATEINFNKRKQEEMICKLCGDPNHFTQGCPSTLGMNKKTNEHFERVAAREKKIRDLFSPESISRIENETGCKLALNEKFLIVSSKEPQVFSKGLDKVHTMILDMQAKSLEPEFTQEDANPSPAKSRVSSPPRSRASSPPKTRVSSPPKSRVSSSPRSRAWSPPKTRVLSPSRSRVSSPPRSRVSSPPRSRVSSPPRSRVSSPRTRASSPPRSKVSSPPRSSRVSSPPRSRVSREKSPRRRGGFSPRRERSPRRRPPTSPLRRGRGSSPSRRSERSYSPRRSFGRSSESRAREETYRFSSSRGGSKDYPAKHGAPNRRPPSHEGQNRNFPPQEKYIKSSGWDVSEQKMDLSPGMDLKAARNPRSIEELEMELKREEMEVMRKRDQQVDEENYMYRERMREMRETYASKFSALRSTQAKQWDEFVQQSFSKQPQNVPQAVHHPYPDPVGTRNNMQYVGPTTVPNNIMYNYHDAYGYGRYQA